MLIHWVLLIFNRNSEQNIELHYDENIYVEKYFQYVLLQDEHLKTKVGSCLNIKESKMFIEEVEDGYGIYDTEDFF